MFETLVSSKIRRTLLEYLLTRPHERFYLRGLAKDLKVSVSPLRRELKRLEQSGMLRSLQEANVLFYMVNADSPEFQHLLSFTKDTPPSQSELGIAETTLSVVKVVEEQAAKAPSAVWTEPLRTPLLIVATSIGVVLMLVIVGFFYLRMTNQRLETIAQQLLAPRAPAGQGLSASSTVMRSNRWQLIPGGIGGLSTAGSREVY